MKKILAFFFLASFGGFLFLFKWKGSQEEGNRPGPPPYAADPLKPLFDTAILKGDFDQRLKELAKEKLSPQQRERIQEHVLATPRNNYFINRLLSLLHTDHPEDTARFLAERTSPDLPNFETLAFGLYHQCGYLKEKNKDYSAPLARARELNALGSGKRFHWVYLCLGAYGAAEDHLRLHVQFRKATEQGHRIALLSALGEAKFEGMVPEIKTILATEKDPEFLSQALLALFKISGPGARDEISRHGDAQDLGLRNTARKLLALIEPH